ncbi:glycosyltransferase [Kluyvera intermedia]|uniref:glycosyltransferase n=1 Tax=Kluyvera intermedia TaxID=61648 RepID=UPI0034A25D1E
MIMKNKLDIKDIVVLSTADWDNPFWTNKQHVALELAHRGHRVLYIESLGLRRPSVNKKDISRIFRRIIKAVKAPRKVRDNIWVWSPISIPFNNYAFVRRLNKLILSSALKFWCWHLKFRDETLWTYNPLTTRFLKLSDFRYVVYHCVDEIKAQPGMPVDIIQDAEEDLVRHADITFVTSLTLLKSRAEWNDNVYYLSNVADYKHFSAALDENLSIPADLEEIPEPRIGFIGAISGYKVNFPLLEEIAKAHPEWSIVMIGDVGEGDPNTDATQLTRHKNIHLMGPRSYQQLPAYLKGFSAALLPNNLNEYTASMFPMKFFEYLAAGKSVVSVDLASLCDFKDYVRIAHSPAEFISALEDITSGNRISVEKCLELAQQYTYQSRTDKMFKLIDEKRNESSNRS